MPSMRTFGGVMGVVAISIWAYGVLPAASTRSEPAVAQPAKPAPSAAALQKPAAPQTPAARPPSAPLLGDHTDGSRARPVHRIALRDADGEVIRPTDQPLLPFSARQTCGADCHDAATVSRGWHFTVTTRQEGGRRGEPWVLVDADTATQLPLSYHEWPGTFRPAEIGITAWQFAKLFGGRLPGGLSGADEQSPALRVRWAVSGELEPNCLACHDASPAYDHAEYGHQIDLENFRWAVAGASGLALVSGAAREMPNTFDFLLPVVEDELRPRMPSVAYAADRFLPGAKVVFDIVREVPARRCYFCHTATDAEHTGQRRWQADEDIHVSRGMSCVECHRNGLDHVMIRGYEGEAAATTQEDTAFTCRGCHLASEPEKVYARGRLGAPYPRHPGLPPIHLQKLSCTACHSGPVPGRLTRLQKTSQSHRLGGLNVNKAPEALPHLYASVFAQDDQGTLWPNRIVWPAFWGRLDSGRVRPIPIDQVRSVMAQAGITLARSATGSWPALETATLARLLGLLQSQPAAAGIPVYVAGGTLHRLDSQGSVTSEPHSAARPYLWPIAHDVRPAALALGARGCQDCHTADAPIFFGRVAVDSPLASGADPWMMLRFQQKLDATYVADFARAFQYRPWLKGMAASAAALLLVLALAYAMPALTRLSAAAAAGRWTRVFVNVAGVVSCSTSAATGLPALLSGQPLSGSRLMIHMVAAGALAASVVLVMLYWSERNRFSQADWNRIRRPLGRAAMREANSYIIVVRKLSFWVAVAAVIPAVSAATLAMFPVLPSVWQPVLFRIHRTAVVPFASAAALFAVCALVSWLLAGAGDRGTPARAAGRGGRLSASAGP